MKFSKAFYSYFVVASFVGFALNFREIITMISQNIALSITTTGIFSLFMGLGAEFVEDIKNNKKSKADKEEGES